MASAAAIALVASASKIASSSPSARSAALAMRGFEAGEFRGGEPDLAGERLAVDEGRVPRRGHEFIAVLRRDLDKIAEHIVVADFQTLNLGFLRITRLQRRHHAAGFIAQRPRLVERRVIARPTKPPSRRDSAGRRRAPR